MRPGATALNREAWILNAIKDGSIETPCLVFDLEAVDRVLKLFSRYLPGVKLFYSVKANNDPTILQHLRDRNIGFDVASVNELGTVLGIGAPLDDIILSNTIKSTKCIREIFSRRIPLTTIDNERDLKALSREATFHSFRPGVLARIKVKPIDVEINLNEKFGCGPEEAVRLLKAASDLGIAPIGVHFHVGTQCWNVASYQAAIESAIGVIQSLKDLHGLDLSVINIGGGYPDELVAEKAGGLESYFSSLGESVKKAQDLGLTVIAEPGRVIAAGACTSVSQVIGRAVHDGKDWIYLDDGIYGLYSTAHFEKRRFDFKPVSGKEGDVQPFVVAGPTCDSLDVVGEDIVLPSDTEPGDYVLAHHAGAYSISVKSHFNGMAQISTATQVHAVAAVWVD